MKNYQSEYWLTFKSVLYVCNDPEKFDQLLRIVISNQDKLKYSFRIKTHLGITITFHNDPTERECEDFSALMDTEYIAA